MITTVMAAQMLNTFCDYSKLSFMFRYFLSLNFFHRDRTTNPTITIKAITIPPLMIEVIVAVTDPDPIIIFSSWGFTYRRLQKSHYCCLYIRLAANISS